MNIPIVSQVKSS